MRIIPTAIGPVAVVLQGDRTAYVRAGTGDHGCRTSDGDPTDAVTVRRKPLSVRGHFNYDDATAAWSVKPAWLSVHRADGGGDATAAMRRTVTEAIIAALGEHVTRAERQAAGDVKALADANDLQDKAAALRATADALDAHAAALRAGGRTIYLEQRMSSGATQTFRTVEMAGGIGRMQPAPEPPDMRNHAARYPMTADELAAASERD